MPPCARRRRTTACRRSRRRSCRYLDLHVNLLFNLEPVQARGPRPGRRRGGRPPRPPDPARRRGRAAAAGRRRRARLGLRDLPPPRLPQGGAAHHGLGGRRDGPVHLRERRVRRPVRRDGPRARRRPDGPPLRARGVPAPGGPRAGQRAGAGPGPDPELLRARRPATATSRAWPSRVRRPGRRRAVHFFQLSLRPGVPLQATLFRLCEARRAGVARALAGPRVDPGRADDPLRLRPCTARSTTPTCAGSTRRDGPCWLIEHDKSAWIFAPTSSPEDLLEAVRGQFGALNPEGAGLYQPGGAIDGAGGRLPLGPEPRDAAAARVRPAVAGRFYPADPAELDAAGRRAARRERAPAGALAGGHGAARGPDLLGQAGGRRCSTGSRSPSW